MLCLDIWVPEAKLTLSVLPYGLVWGCVPENVSHKNAIAITLQYFMLYYKYIKPQTQVFPGDIDQSYGGIVNAISGIKMWLIASI